MTADYGKGWFTDLHGHGHTIQRLELGYMLEGADLRLSNATLDGNGAYEDESSFRVFSEQSTTTFSALLRGNVGLGTLFANAGYPAVPSLQDMQPDEGESYFSGGYNTGAHGCSSGGSICGLQIEHNNAGVRDDATNRANYAAALAKVYETYLAQNFGISLYSTGGEILVDNVNANNDTTRARFQASANWAANTNNTQKHLNDFALTDGDGPTNDGAAFLFRIASPGSHSVYAWWPSASSRTTSASYRVFALDGGTMLFDGVRNQQANGGQWNLLGTWTFPQAGWAKVLVSRSLSGPGKLAADAIRIVRH